MSTHTTDTDQAKPDATEARSPAGDGLGALPVRGLFECDCDPEDAHEMEDYRCDNCGKTVMVCLGCYAIRSGCQCGNCEEGATFEES